MTVTYICKRCGTTADQARETGCERGPCPMELYYTFPNHPVIPNAPAIFDDRTALGRFPFMHPLATKFISDLTNGLVRAIVSLRRKN